MAFKLNSNGRSVTVDASGDMPLLWVLRDEPNLKGTKCGCDIGVCGSCTVHVDGEPARSCVMMASSAAGKKIATIEGLSEDGSHSERVAREALDVPQRGYCQTGQNMAAQGGAASGGDRALRRHDGDPPGQNPPGGGGRWQRGRRPLHRHRGVRGAGRRVKARGARDHPAAERAGTGRAARTGMSGTMLLLFDPAPAGFKPLAIANLFESASDWAPIALVDGTLLIRGQEQPIVLQVAQRP